MFSKVKRSSIIQLMQSTIIIKLLQLNINKTGHFMLTWDLRIMIESSQYLMKTLKINVLLLLTFLNVIITSSIIIKYTLKNGKIKKYALKIDKPK
jgi:hypothetical protein